MYKESLEEQQAPQQKFIPEKLIRGKPTTAAGITVQEAEKTRRILEQQAKQIREEAKKESDELRAELARTRKEASEEAETLREQLRQAEGKAILERSTMMEQTEKSKKDILKQTEKQTEKLSKELKESRAKQARLLALVVSANKKLETAKKSESKNRKEMIKVANKNKEELIAKLKDAEQDTKIIKTQLKQAQQERTTFAKKAEQTATQLAEQAEISRINLERQATEQRVMIAQETTRRFNILDKDIKKRLIEKEAKKIGNKKIKGISKENVDILINTMPADEKKLYGQSVRDLLSGNINANSMVSGIIGFGGMMATGNPMASLALQSGFNFIRNVVGFDFNSVFSDSNVRQTRSEIQQERKSRETEKTKSFENKLNALIKKQEKEQDITLKQITTKRKQDEKEFQKAIKQQQKEQERLTQQTIKQASKLEEQTTKLKEQKSRIAQLLTKPVLTLTESERKSRQIEPPILTMTETERKGRQIEPSIPKPELTTSTQNILSIPSLPSLATLEARPLPRIPTTLEIKESERSQPQRKEQKQQLTLKESERSAKLLSRPINIEGIKMSEQKHTAKDLKTVSVAMAKVIATKTGQDEKDIDMEATSDIVEDLSPSFVSRMADAIRSIPTTLRNNAGNIMAVMADAIQSGVGSAMIPLSPIDNSFINSVLDIPEFKTPPTSAQAPLREDIARQLTPEEAVSMPISAIRELKRASAPMEEIQERKMRRFETAFERIKGRKPEGLEAKKEIEEVDTDSAMEELEDDVREVLRNEFENDLSSTDIDNYIRTLEESDLRYIQRNSIRINDDIKLSILVDKQKLLKDIKNVGSSIPPVLNRVVDELKQRYQQTYGQINAMAEGKIIRSAVGYVSEMSAQVLGRVMRAINTREFVSVLSNAYKALPSVQDIHSMTVRDVPPLVAPRSEDISDGVGAGIVGGAVGSGIASGSAMGAVSGAIPGAIAGTGVSMAIAPALREYYRARGVNVDDPNIKKKLNYYSMIPAAVAGGVVGYSGLGQQTLSGAGITEKKIMVDADVLAETQAKEEQEVTKNKQWAPKQIAPTPAILDEPQQEKYSEDLETTLFDYVVPTSEGADGTIMTNQLKKNQFMNQQLRYTDAGVFVPRELWGQLTNTKPATIKKLALGSKPLIPLPELEFIPADNETTWDNVARLQFVNKENTSVGLFDPYGDFSDVTNYMTITPDSVLFTENP
jgi:outer membrane lipoprotein SlyB